MGIFFAALGLPGLCGFIGEFFVFRGAFTASILITALSTIGIVVTAAYLLWTIQRVLLGPLNPKYEKMPDADLREIAAGLGADVPFFLVDGPQLGTGDGRVLKPLDLPQDFWVVLLVPRLVQKPSTASVYAAFDLRDGAAGFDERRAALLAALDEVRRPRDLAALPPNDLASSPLADELRALGAFRADVTGAGPAVYALFHHKDRAQEAQRALKAAGESWLTAPAWYG
jgi:4-diphosphocytidyl-2C-methyl-D-erythritol kinase